MKPNDASLEHEMRDLAARTTMQQGNYDNDTDFRSSIKDRDSQDKLHDQGNLVQSDDARADTVALARQEYEQDPDIPGKIDRYVSALCATEKVENEQLAIEVLEKAFADLGQFRYRQQAGEVRNRRLFKNLRALQGRLKRSPDDQTLKSQVRTAAVKLLKSELVHYKLCVENYPTDAKLKYEYARRLMQAKQYDQAIPLFQEARTDPRQRLTALAGIGQCFFYKAWYPDAIETYQEALSLVERKEGQMAKELLYNLARAYQADGDDENALASYRKVAQIDFNYSDVKARVDALRKSQREKS